MSEKNRNQRVKVLEKWTPFYIIGCTFLGAILGSFLIYLFQGEFPIEPIAAGLVVVLILTAIEIIKRKRKKDNLSEVDERTAHNIFRFFAYTSHAFLGIL